MYSWDWGEFYFILYSSAVQPAAREGISCGPPSSHINCNFGPVISRMKSTCKIQQCLMVFCVSKFQKNGRMCGFHWTFGSKKCFSFRGLCPPDPPTRGSAPGPCWRLRPQAPLIGSRFTRSPWPSLIAARQLVENWLIARGVKKVGQHCCSRFFC